ncbi:hypothetical protein DWG18_01335 [Lysobacter sp. TY2-98]|uniref:hypothetical protein n=1 Tax=Lysobacter sp. TY2-98 TaxID=2290922 RepID=UPI000E2003CD|nr:hypothetical protein [Lysobacter sp. TY2-98]AXK71062.1 hypothetical protein DWG18_01335 [Lysobacter sp. TY2-98]
MPDDRALETYAALPLIPLIYSSQAVNAVMLPFHVVALQLLTQNGRIMGGRTLRSCDSGGGLDERWA